MRTQLPEKIETVEQAKQFLSDLHKNKELYHPEDDARDIEWNSCEKPSVKELNKLNQLMNQVYNQDFDPCGYIIDNLNF